MKKLLIPLLLLSITACSYSEGERAGQLVKLSRKGFIFKTFEGELATVAKGAAATMVTNSFLFSVKDMEIAKKLQEAMNAGKQVSLSYEQEFFVFPGEGDTKYYITKVSVLE